MRSINLLQYGKKVIDVAQIEYKENYLTKTGYNNMPTLKQLMQNNPLLQQEVNKAYNQKRALQSSLIGECVAVQALADFSHFTFSQANDGRAVYEKDEWRMIYYGDPVHNDIDIVSPEGHIAHLEIKSHIARAGDCDLAGYNDDGTTTVRPGTIFDTKEGRSLIEVFNELNKNWAYLGSNMKIDTQIDLCKRMTRNYFSFIAACIVIYPNSIVYYRVDNDFYKLIDYGNSEIRSCGRNKEKLKCHKTIDNWIQKHNYLWDNKIRVPLTDVIAIKGRGMPTITRYGLIGHIFFVYAKDCQIQDNYIIFNKENIYQVKPHGSIHVSFKEVM